MTFISRKELNLIKEYRLLWNQHAEWTRMVINALVLQSPNVHEEVERLLRNPIDFGKALEVFYGQCIAAQFANLLTEHLKIAAELTTATMAGDGAEVERITNLFFQNGNEIALFLGSINPYWSYMEWREMFFTHLRYVQDLIRTMVNKEYGENTRIYDLYELEILEMADTMSSGIIRQFFCKYC